MLMRPPFNILEKLRQVDIAIDKNANLIAQMVKASAKLFPFNPRSATSRFTRKYSARKSAVTPLQLSKVSCPESVFSK